MTLTDQPAPSAATEETDVERIAEIRQRAEAAQPGPWPLPDERVAVVAGPLSLGGRNYDPRLPLDHEGCDEWPWNTEENMVFAYRARDDVPWLLAHIDALRTDRDLWHQRSDTALRLQDLFETWSVRWKTAAKRYRELYRKTVELDPLAASTVHRLDTMADELEHLEEERSHLIRLNATQRGETIRLRADLAASGAREARLTHELHQERSRWESLERRHENLIDAQKHYGESRADMERRLDALLWVWCSGGCANGILRWVDLSEYDNRRVAISEEVIKHAIRNMKRLVTKFRNLHFRPFYEGYLVAGHPWRKAVEMASAELDRLYPSTLAAPGRADQEGDDAE